jgi:hypothetical protein
MRHKRTGTQAHTFVFVVDVENLVARINFFRLTPASCLHGFGGDKDVIGDRIIGDLLVDVHVMRAFSGRVCLEVTVTWTAQPAWRTTRAAKLVRK